VALRSAPSSASIAVVDPDAAAALLVAALRQAGYHASRLESGAAATRLTCLPRAAQPALVLLELILPDADGLAVCAHLAANGVPVIVRSATRRRSDPVSALRAGAEDFVANTAAPDELLARIRRVLIHRFLHRPQRQPIAAAATPHVAPGASRTIADGTSEPIAPAFYAGTSLTDLTFDDRQHRIRFGGRSVRLSTSDYALLTLLAARPECPVPPSAIAAELWPAASPNDRGVTSLVPGCVYHLRQRLRLAGLPLAVCTMRGYGYALIAHPHNPPAEPAAN
jgi:DNA-binding response OmpR family regulator